jgi:hypothetical protein
MIKVLDRLLAKILGEPLENIKPTVQKRPNVARDFRAVEIVPRRPCCEAATQAAGKRYLLSKAPRVPLVGCTMPMTCSCMYRKNADRRGGNRRLLGAGASRLFAGVEGRKNEGRRLAEM